MQYKVVRCYHLPELEAQINRWAAEGWEMFSFTTATDQSRSPAVAYIAVMQKPAAK